MNAQALLDQILTQNPVPLGSISGFGGIYALEDECGVIRYIGETSGPFQDSIFSRHVAGDDNSHKYSSAFNAGRLWHPSSRDRSSVKRLLSDPSDGRIAKRVRREFARNRCHARILPLPGLSKVELRVVEDAILAITPVENKIWNDSRQLVAYEPQGLDAFLSELSLPPVDIEALERQGARWNSLSPADRLVKRTAL